MVSPHVPRLRDSFDEAKRDKRSAIYAYFCPMAQEAMGGSHASMESSSHLASLFRYPLSLENLLHGGENTGRVIDEAREDKVEPALLVFRGDTKRLSASS